MVKAPVFSAPELKANGILDRAKHECKLDDAQIATAQEFYNHHLQLCYENADHDVIHKWADCLWHTHILFTKDYTDYCNKVLGGYLHHIPEVPPPPPPTDAQIATENVQYTTRGWNPIPGPYATTSCH
ncbi:MAG TPA: hypothetical protein VFR33_16095 [Candidatus Dormibacteraeota bacterium]|nr:hypothetical protein [Candidatus Dormibacteraeota bacterium]